MRKTTEDKIVLVGESKQISIWINSDDDVVVKVEASSVNANQSEVSTQTSQTLYKIHDPDGYTNLRKSPNGDIIKRVYENERFQIIGNEGSWKKIKLSDGTVGYMLGNRIINAN